MCVSKENQICLLASGKIKKVTARIYIDMHSLPFQMYAAMGKVLNINESHRSVERVVDTGFHIKFYIVRLKIYIKLSENF